MELISLKTDGEFKRLNAPLTETAYWSMEERLLRDGCREPLRVWQNLLLDGYDRYALCLRHGVSFEVCKMTFSDRAEAVAWICATQMRRGDLTEEMKKYLMGKQYNAERTRSDCSGYVYKPYTARPSSVPGARIFPDSARGTAIQLGKVYRLSCSSIQAYGIYAAALDRIAGKSMNLHSEILSGAAIISQENVVRISDMSERQLEQIVEVLGSMDRFHLQTGDIRRIAGDCRIGRPETPCREMARPSVKDIPTYDPDTEVCSLSLTIPTWRALIERVQRTASLKEISESARHRLHGELTSLKKAIEQMAAAMKEDALDGR